MEFVHTPVLLNEVIESLHIRPDGIYADGTLGGAGHSAEIASRLSTGRLIGVDQDEEAIEAASRRLLPFQEKVTVVHDNFRHLGRILRDLDIASVDGILLDLGVSSYQLDNRERGFSYSEDAPLDMRMDRQKEKTAADIINTYSEQDLARILYTYGEEKFSRSIARKIVQEREKGPILTTGQLSDIVRKSIPAKARRTGGNPSKRTFQAVRIELNEELSVLTEAMDEMIDLLSDGGRLCVITFHSLEDRIVKQAFKKAENPCVCPPDFPVCVCGKKSKGKVLTTKPILPGEEELGKNPRSASAKLRVFERRMTDV